MGREKKRVQNIESLHGRAVFLSCLLWETVRSEYDSMVTRGDIKSSADFPACPLHCLLFRFGVAVIKMQGRLWESEDNAVQAASPRGGHLTTHQRQCCCSLADTVILQIHGGWSERVDGLSGALSALRAEPSENRILQNHIQHKYNICESSRTRNLNVIKRVLCLISSYNTKANTRLISEKSSLTLIFVASFGISSSGAT